MDTLKPKLRFPEFEKNWLTKNLGSFADVSKLAGYEFTKHIQYEEKGKIIALRGLNIKNNSLDLTDVKYIDNSELDKLSRSKLYINDIMFTYIGTIGEVALIKENDKFYLAPNVSRLRVTNDEIIPTFILQYFNTRKMKDEEIAKYVSSSSQPALTMENVRKFEFHIPSFEEQTKIANFLTSVDEKLNLLKEKKELLEDYKKGIMQKIFNQEIRFKDDNGNDFEDWEEKSLGEVTSITIGEFVIKTRQNPNGKYPVYNGGKSCTGYYDEFNNDGNKIVISARGANAGFVNFEKGKFWAGNSCYSVGILDKYHFEIIYFYYYVKFNENTFTENQQAANIPSVSKKDVEKFNIKIPSLEEQTKIANFLSSIDEKIELVSNQIQDTLEYKKGLLQQMFV